MRTPMRVTILRGMSGPAVIALFGPTGVGKTAVAVALADRLRSERGEDPVAVSADGIEERTIVLAVERNTKQLEPMIHDGNE